MDKYDLDFIFKHLMLRAKTEKCFINIYDDTIWLSDCGFGFDKEYFCVRPKLCDDDEKIARWVLPKLRHFWERQKMQIEFKKLVQEIKNRNLAEYENEVKEKQAEKQRTAKKEIFKLLGLQWYI